MKSKRTENIYNCNLRITNKIIWWLIQLIVLANALALIQSELVEAELPETYSVVSADNEEYPTVYKCCPLHQRYESGKCVDSGHRMDREEHWIPPKTMIQDNTTTELPDYPVVFRLLSAQPNCTSGVLEKIILNETIGENMMDGRDGPGDHLQPQSDVVLTPQGYLIWTDENNFANTYHIGNFCMDQVNRTAFIAVMCKPACSPDRPCIRKCCPPDLIVDDTNERCVRPTQAWKPYLYDLSPAGEVEPVEMENLTPHFQVGVKCKEMYFINLRKEERENTGFYALLNETLITIQDGMQKKYTPDIFCIDGVVSPNRTDTADPNDMFDYSGLELDQVAIICYPEHPPQPEPGVFLLYAIAEYTSSFFLTLTAVVYLILWEYQNIHGWLQFSYVISLFFAYSFLASSQIFAKYIHEASMKVCETIGAAILFFFLSAFFWLTSMNFDLWWTFSGCRPLRASTRTGEKKRFIIFALLSWGGSVALTSAAVTLDSIYGSDPVWGKYLPNFGANSCYFHNEESKLPFFYAPVGIMLFVNIIFFLSTIYSLHKLQKDTRFATKQSSKQDKKRFLLFMKLFIVMGVFWIFELISSIMVLFWPEHKKFWSNLFLATDLITALQGFFIFLIFTCKPNTCKQLEGQFKKSSTRLEESRDKTVGSSTKSRLPRWFLVGFCTIALVAVQSFRKLFNYCGRSTRTLEGRRNISHNTVTSTFEKSRKASDSSAVTTLSVLDPGSIEMETTY